MRGGTQLELRYMAEQRYVMSVKSQSSNSLNSDSLYELLIFMKVLLSLFVSPTSKMYLIVTKWA